MEYIYIIVQLMIMMMMYMSIRLIKESRIMSDILNRPISELPHKLEMIFFCFFFFPECSHPNLPGNRLLVMSERALTAHRYRSQVSDHTTQVLAPPSHVPFKHIGSVLARS